MRKQLEIEHEPLSKTDLHRNILIMSVKIANEIQSKPSQDKTAIENAFVALLETSLDYFKIKENI